MVSSKRAREQESKRAREQKKSGTLFRTEAFNKGNEEERKERKGISTLDACSPFIGHLL
jgi:hypothetical protein